MRRLNLSTRQELGIGSALTTFAALGIVVSLLAGWSQLERPLGFLLGFTFGIAGGMGAVLAIAGLVDWRLERRPT